MTLRLKVERNPGMGTYDAFVGADLAGTLVYERVQDRLILTSISVPEGHQNQGIAGRLVQAALDDAKAESSTVTPLCPFAVSYIGRHQEYATLIDSDHPGRYRR